MSESKKYEPREFMAKLTSGELQAPPEIVGIVKTSDERPDEILFSASGCKNWVGISPSILSSVEHLGMSPCDDHSHPRVRLTLDSSTEGAAPAIMALLNHYAAARQSGNANRPHTHAAPAPPTMVPLNAANIFAGRVASAGRGLFRLLAQDNCPSSRPNCVGGVSGCEFGCACCDADGLCGCSTCCLS